MINTIIVGGQYTNPDENLVDVNLCRNCQNNEKYDSMDICYECSDDFDEKDTISNCCSANIDTDRNLCYECKDNAHTLLDDYCREYNFNKKTYKYNN